MNQNVWTGLQGWLLLALFAFSCLLAFQGTRGVDNASEGRYAECARSMVASGNYLVPTLNGFPHWTKPPLGYWVPALGIEVFGVNAWGARTGNALAGALTVLFVAAAAAAFWSPAVGLAAGWIYLSSPFPFLGAHVVTVDTLLTCCVAAAVWCYAEARRRRGGLGWVLGFWLACGLGFMTKGPLVILPLLPLLVWHGRSGQPFRLLHPAGLVTFAVVGLWWYAVIFTQHPELLGYYIKEEMIARVSGRVNDETTHNRQFYKPFLMYLPVLTIGLGAWLYYAGRVFLDKQLWQPHRVWERVKSTGLDGLLLIWLLVPLLLFFVSKSRLHLYVLPLFPAVAFAAAWELVRRNGGVFPARKVLGIALSTLLLLVAAKGIAGHKPRKENMEPVYKTFAALPDYANTKIYTFENSEAYALQYYLHGKLRHSTYEEKKEPWEIMIHDVVAEIKAAPPTAHYVFWGVPKKINALNDQLVALGFRIEVIELKGWRALRILGVPA